MMDHKKSFSIERMIIRPATPADIYRIHEIHTSAIQILCIQDYTPEQIEAWSSNRTPEGYLPYIEKFRFFIAEYHGFTVGYARYSLKTNEFCSLFVDPEYIRQGIATLLTKFVFQDARDHGLNHLWLNGSFTAVPFYKTMGFTVEFEKTYSFQDVSLQCLRMRKTLL